MSHSTNSGFNRGPRGRGRAGGQGLAPILRGHAGVAAMRPHYRLAADQHLVRLGCRCPGLDRLARVRRCPVVPDPLLRLSRQQEFAVAMLDVPALQRRCPVVPARPLLRLPRQKQLSRPRVAARLVAACRTDRGFASRSLVWAARSSHPGRVPARTWRANIRFRMCGAPHACSRDEDWRRTIEAEASEVRFDRLEISTPKVSDHILKEDGVGLALCCDSLDSGPEVALVVGSELTSGEGVGLAGVSRNEEIHDSTPRAAVEGSGISPQRRVIQPSVASSRNQNGCSRCFVLQVTDRSSVGTSQLHASVETSAAGCDRQDSGTCSHMCPSDDVTPGGACPPESFRSSPAAAVAASRSRCCGRARGGRARTPRCRGCGWSGR